MLTRLRGTPHGISRGIALGIVGGTLVPPGGQLVIGFPVALALRANLLAYTLGTMVSNPVTYVPYYYFTCRVGQLALNLLGAEISLGANFKAMLRDALGLNFTAALQMLGPISACWIVGGLLVGLGLSVPGYYLSYLFVIEFRKLREFRRKHRLAWLAEKLRLKRHVEPPSEPAPVTISPDEEAPDETPPPRAE